MAGDARPQANDLLAPDARGGEGSTASAAADRRRPLPQAWLTAGRLRGRLLLALASLLVLMLVAILVYHYVEGLPWLDAVYLVAITVSTVGYHDYDPTTVGKVFTVVFIGYWLLVGALVLRMLTEYVLEELTHHSFTVRRMQKQINGLSGHYIICGFGRMGRQIASDFRRSGLAFVIVENDPERMERVEEAGCLAVEGDATHDEILEQAGIQHARGLIAVAGSDATNIFITLTARGLRPDLYIVARAAAADAENKLLRAGASRVVSPYVIGGRRIAAAVLSPTVVEFFDAVLHSDETDLGIGEATIPAECRLEGTTLRDSGLREEVGVIIIGIRRTGRFITNPPPDTVLRAEDVLIAIGTGEQIEELVALIGRIASS